MAEGGHRATGLVRVRVWVRVRVRVRAAHILYLDRMPLRGSRTVAAVITRAYNAMRRSRFAAAAKKKPVP